ncbi:MAG: sensor histidine kinase [Thermoanaerobaculales bacterium]
MWRWRSNSLTFRLTGTLIIALALLLALAGIVQVGLQERFARGSTRLNGLAMSETLYGALHSYMLHNDRAGLHAMVRSIAERSPNVRVRIFNKEGEIVFSSDTAEIGQRLDPRSEACFKCHAANRPIERLPVGERTRSFAVAGVPALGVIRPIENEPACSSASCHAHPASKRLLGVLDVTELMTPIEGERRQTTTLMVGATGGALLLVVAVVVLVVRGAVHRPIKALTRTLAALGAGDYSARYENGEISEFAYLGRAVNKMAQELQHANVELVEWAQTLERRVEEKTAELRQAQEQMVRVERMASLGKLAAVVAHEINNPLASVVTYSKVLLRRQTKRPTPSAEERESVQILEAIASESARCGEIVSNLLLFARRTGSRMEPSDINETVRRSLFLIKHKMDLAQVKAETRLDTSLPPLVCDPAQVEQALLALAINAVEAMPGGGTLTITTVPTAQGGVRLEVADTGVGMDEEVRRHIFEPFFTTKNEREGRGLGLGLAVVYGIVQRHNGTIEVASAPGQGTKFTVTLPQATSGPGGES